MGSRLKGKVAVITGGASGMGLATTEAFIEEGASVVIADIQADKGRSLEARLGARARFIRCDVTNEGDIAAAVGLSVAAFGGLDVMFHCAGTGGTRSTIEDMTVEGWDRTQNLLLRSSVLCIKHAIAPLRARGGGSIILTSSVAALNLGDGIGAAAYIVAKGGVLTLAKAAALELGPQSIRVNTIVPGFFPTPLIGDLIGTSKDVADRMGKYMQQAGSEMQPLPRCGDPRDIAYAATYLASDESQFVTAAELKVDGGLSLHRRRSSASISADAQQALALAEAEAQQDSLRSAT